MFISRAIYLVVFAMLSGYAVQRFRRRTNGSDSSSEVSRFRPHIGFTRLDGMESLSLLLDNRSSEFVWVEEIEVFLSDLNADQQTAEPTCREIQKIRQTVRDGDMLPISLAQVIYKAAGGPQRKYTCLLSSVLRYRIGEELFEKSLDRYRIRMIGLTASSVHRERKQLQSSPEHDVPAASR